MAKDSKLNKMTIEEVLAYEPIKSQMSQAGYTAEVLKPILEDFNNQRDVLSTLVQRYATEIAAFEGVHSISSRVKSVGSLCEKILRKSDPRRVKIDVDNYKTEIQDLVGIRALYVFPDEFAIVYNQIYKKYSRIFDGNPVVRYRKGDNLELFKKALPDSKVTYPENNDDYRSIHYLFHHCVPDEPDIRIELQTRTIFEEGWSEINHRTVYGMEGSEKSEMLNVLSPVLSRVVGTSNDIASLIYSIAYNDTASDLQQKISDFEISGASGQSLVDTLADFIKNL